jgi:uncharacterized protein (TIGR02996 family)
MDDAATTGEWEPDEFEDQRTRNDPDTAVEHGFLLRLRDEPNDLAMRMVFADWLEQTAQTEKAEVVRLLAEVPVEDSPGIKRLRLLGTTLDREWMAVVSRAPIDKCLTENIQFRYQCPKSWEALTSTDDATVRFCSQCQQNVYFCSTVDDVRRRGKANDCVAFSPSLRRQDALAEYDARKEEMIVMGDIAPPEDWDPITHDQTAPYAEPPAVNVNVAPEELDEEPTR